MERDQVSSYEFDGMTAKLNNNKKVSVRASKDDLAGVDEEDWDPPEGEESQSSDAASDDLEPASDTSASADENVETLD